MPLSGGLARRMVHRAGAALSPLLAGIIAAHRPECAGWRVARQTAGPLGGTDLRLPRSLWCGAARRIGSRRPWSFPGEPPRRVPTGPTDGASLPYGRRPRRKAGRTQTPLSPSGWTARGLPRPGLGPDCLIDKLHPGFSGHRLLQVLRAGARRTVPGLVRGEPDSVTRKARPRACNDFRVGRDGPRESLRSHEQRRHPSAAIGATGG